VELTGIEPDCPSAPSVAKSGQNPGKETTPDDSEPPLFSASTATENDPRDPVEQALASALTTAAAGGRFDVVAQLARELEARRLARAGNVVVLDSGRRKGGV
jgi:hypothetical protein